MITIFICTNDEVAKKITKEYLDRDNLPYVNMLEGVTYQQAVAAIEKMEKMEVTSSDKVEPPTVFGLPVDIGELVAICDECLSPSVGTVYALCAFVHKDGSFTTSLEQMTQEECDKKLKAGVLLVKTEREFYQKYGRKNNQRISDSVPLEDQAE